MKVLIDDKEYVPVRHHNLEDTIAAYICNSDYVQIKRLLQNLPTNKLIELAQNIHNIMYSIIKDSG